MEYNKPALTADNVILRINAESGLDILLIKRKHPPFEGMWALPGGFVEEQETAQTAAIRELQEETGITGLNPIFFGFYSDPGRDPRGWVVTAAYMIIIYQDVTIEPGDDASEAVWFNTGVLPELAFDHKKIISDALRMIKEALQTIQKQGQFFDTQFTLAEIQRIKTSFMQ